MYNIVDVWIVRKFKNVVEFVYDFFYSFFYEEFVVVWFFIEFGF